MSSIKLNYNRMKVASMQRRSAAADGFSFGGSSGGFGYGGAGSRMSINRYNPVYDDLSEGTIVEQFMPVDPRRLHRIWRRIKLQDPVAGPAVDLYSELPWSDFQLTAIEDREVAGIYTDALNAINITSLLPEITSEFLSMGKVIGHLTVNESRGIWDRLIIHDPDWIRVTPIPVGGFQPKLDIIPTPDMRRWAHSQDPRDISALEEIGELAYLIREGKEIPLPPENTFYIPRRTAPYDVVGASIYTRIIMFVAYEKALVNATIAASRRRASRIRHVSVGIDDVWEPTREEIDDILNLFMQADEDPVGAIVGTRTGVNINEVGGSGPQDIVKISDEWDFLLKGRLNALGVSEQFLTGESQFNTLEQLMSVFLERVKAHRKYIENVLLYEKLLKPLARHHGFVRRKTAELDHRIRVSKTEDLVEDDSNLIIPTISWEKTLRPIADRDYLEILEMMDAKGIPVTKRTWAASAGFDLDSEMQQYDDDLETSRQLSEYRKKVERIAPNAQGGTGGLGGVGGDMGLNGLGGDMGGMGGGLDMGGLGGGGMGGMEGGEGGNAPLELPQIGASTKTAAPEIRTAAHHRRTNKESIITLTSLPIWGKRAEFMGLSKDSAELAARRVLDYVGDSLSKSIPKSQVRKILSTGNSRKDQVLRYLLTRVGIIRNADISREVAQDIQRNLQNTIGGQPSVLRDELRVVASCVQLGERKRLEKEINSSVRENYFKESSVVEDVSEVVDMAKAEGKNPPMSLLTGYPKEKW